MRIFNLGFTLLFLLFSLALTAQEARTVVMKTQQFKVQSYRSPQLEIAGPDKNPFIAFSVAIRGEQLTTAIREVRYKTDGGQWLPFPKEDHYISDTAWNAMVFLKADQGQTEIKIEFNSPTRLDQVKANFYFPKDSEELLNAATGRPLKAETLEVEEDCGCAKPALVERSVWCPSNNCPPNPSPQSTDVKFLIVHHTAGSNVASDWAAVVRSIWNFHVNTNGWADIGYNFLIDTHGKIYQGREDDTRGAHFSGQNSETSGMALIGNFSSSNPSNDMLTALQNLLVWKSCDQDLNPVGTAFHNSSGKTLATISGHRDGGATECPGDRVYAMLPDIRSDVDSQLSSCKLAIDDFDNPYFKVAPNPFTDEIRIDPVQGHRFDLVLYTVLGQELVRKTGLSSSVNIATTALPKGLYILHIVDGQRSIQLKLVKD